MENDQPMTPLETLRKIFPSKSDIELTDALEKCSKNALKAIIMLNDNETHNSSSVIQTTQQQQHKILEQQKSTGTPDSSAASSLSPQDVIKPSSCSPETSIPATNSAFIPPSQTGMMINFPSFQFPTMLGRPPLAQALIANPLFPSYPNSYNAYFGLRFPYQPAPKHRMDSSQ